MSVNPDSLPWYGTTFGGGGTTGCPTCGGTVFSITPTGTEKVLHLFASVGDGSSPEAGLINVSGTLYGTTWSGGTYGNGTVYSITRRGKETVLHSFGSGSDGANPQANLVNVSGILYGTTAVGGMGRCFNQGCGTVFSITPSGTEIVLHSLAGADGYYPTAGMINLNGTLYGTTTGGGSTGCIGHVGCGTVFSITPSGAEKILYVFAGGSDSFPLAGLIDVKGTLYGTAAADPPGLPCSGPGCGSVFSIRLDGTEKTLHSFGSGSDGYFPTAGLIDVNGTLYGTTNYGGTNNAGTVFSITRRGTEKVLYSFKGGSDGANPMAGLTAIKNTLTGTYTLYGTTSGGGTGSCSSGCGTVFSIKP